MPSHDIFITTTINERGVVVIPKVIREYLQIQEENTLVSFKITDEGVFLERVVVPLKQKENT